MGVCTRDFVFLDCALLRFLSCYLDIFFQSDKICNIFLKYYLVVQITKYLQGIRRLEICLYLSCCLQLDILTEVKIEQINNPKGRSTLYTHWKD